MKLKESLFCIEFPLPAYCLPSIRLEMESYSFLTIPLASLKNKSPLRVFGQFPLRVFGQFPLAVFGQFPCESSNNSLVSLQTIPLRFSDNSLAVFGQFPCESSDNSLAVFRQFPCGLQTIPLRVFGQFPYFVTHQ